MLKNYLKKNIKYLGNDLKKLDSKISSKRWYKFVKFIIKINIFIIILLRKIFPCDYSNLKKNVKLSKNKSFRKKGESITYFWCRILLLFLS